MTDSFLDQGKNHKENNPRVKSEEQLVPKAERFYVSPFLGRIAENAWERSINLAKSDADKAYSKKSKEPEPV